MDLRTRRLRMEPLEPRHAELLLDGLRDPRLYEFIAETPPQTVETLRDRYAIWANRRSPNKAEIWLNWAVYSLTDERYIGYVQATLTSDRSATIAYVLFLDAWGKGYAREAVKRMIEHLIEAHRTVEFRAYVDTRNHRSIALLQSLGFINVGVRKDAELIHGVLSDEVTFRKSALPK